MKASSILPINSPSNDNYNKQRLGSWGLGDLFHRRQDIAGQRDASYKGSNK